MAAAGHRQDQIATLRFCADSADQLGGHEGHVTASNEDPLVTSMLQTCMQSSQCTLTEIGVGNLATVDFAVELRRVGDDEHLVEQRRQAGVDMVDKARA